MDRDNFKAAAAGFPDPFRLLIRESLESTNDEVRTLAKAGTSEGLVLIAERQTAGRGRRGSAWFSPAGESLAFSVLLRPTERKALWPRLALAAGLAVTEALESFGVQAGIKWPNDVWIGHRKVAGILVEAGTDFVVVGIGLNVNTTEFPAEVADIATSLKIETSIDYQSAEVLGAIIQKLSLRRQQIDHDFGDLIDAVRQRCVLTGKQVSLTTCKGPRSGVVEGLSPGGELMLRTTSGLERLIQADEVRITS